MPPYWDTGTGTGNVWSTWASNSTAISFTNNTWTTWAGTTSGTNTLDSVWISWGSGTSYRVAQQIWPAAQRTPEQIEADRVAREARDEQYRIQEEERKAAVARAEELLKDNLSEAQRKEYEKDKHFHVVAGGKTYRIRKGWSGNVELLNGKGEVLSRYCIHPTTYVPEEDNMLAQKLMLETAEEEFVRVANRTVVRAA